MIIKAKVEFDILLEEEGDLEDIAKYLETHTQEEMNNELVGDISKFIADEIGENVDGMTVTIEIEN